MPYTKYRRSGRYNRMSAAANGRGENEMQPCLSSSTQRYIVAAVLFISFAAHAVVGSILTWQYNVTTVFHSPKWASDSAQWIIAANFVFAAWNFVEFCTTLAWKPMDESNRKSRYWTNGWVSFVFEQFDKVVQSAAGIGVRWLVTSISLVFITQFCFGDHSIISNTPFLVLAALVVGFNAFMWLFERLAEYYITRIMLVSSTTASKKDDEHDYRLAAAFASISILSLIAIVLIITIEFASTIHEEDWLVNADGDQITKTMTEVMYGLMWLYFVIIFAIQFTNVLKRSSNCVRANFSVYYIFLTLAVTTLVGGFGIALSVNLHAQN